MIRTQREFCLYPIVVEIIICMAYEQSSGALWRHDRTAMKEKIEDFLSSIILSGSGSLINSYLPKGFWIVGLCIESLPVKMLLLIGYFLWSSWNKWLFGAYWKLKGCRLVRYFLSHRNRRNWAGWPLIQNTVIYQEYMGLNGFSWIYVISFNMIFLWHFIEKFGLLWKGPCMFVLLCFLLQ